MNPKGEFSLGIFSVFIILFVIFFYYFTPSKISPNKQNNPRNVIAANREVSPTTPIAQTLNLTWTEVEKHGTLADCWIVIANRVYNVTNFLDRHPGGVNRILPYCGKDATVAFSTKGGEGSHSSRADAELTRLYIGDIGSSQISQPPITQSQQQPIRKREEDNDDD